MYIRHRNRRLRVSEISSNTDQNDASFLMNDAVTGVEANIVQAKSLYRSRAGIKGTIYPSLKLVPSGNFFLDINRSHHFLLKKKSEFDRAP